MIDVDAETFAETLAAIVAIGALSTSLSIAVTNMGADTEAEIDLDGSIAYVFAEKLTLTAASTYGIDSVGLLPLTITAEMIITDWLTLTVAYGNDDLNSGALDDPVDVETGAITFTAKATF